ncbi:hypothetical protein [Bacteroides heparinolyticus]|uniref:hypothetical protein n=1 Tax=Prevotella heparinolytica TaxID=28113 RepID=UPI00359F2256
MKVKVDKSLVRTHFSVEQLEQRLEMAKWSLFVKSTQDSKTGTSVAVGGRMYF